MLAAIIKALPSLWFLLKECLTKPKDGVISPAARSKRPWRLIVIGLFGLIVLAFRYVLVVTDENAKLETKVKELASVKPVVATTTTTQAPPDMVSKDQMELRLLQQQFQSLQADYKVLSLSKNQLLLDNHKLTWELAQCKVPPKVAPVEKSKSDAAKRLERLEDKEGNN